MKSKYVLVSALFFGLSSHQLFGQDLLTQFKTLEKKVRFNDPDQLVEFAHQLDSTSIATIHKKLYDKRTDAKVNLKDALEELSTNVIASMGKDPKAVFDSYLEDIEIDIAEAG